MSKMPPNPMPYVMRPEKTYAKHKGITLFGGLSAGKKGARDNAQKSPTTKTKSEKPFNKSAQKHDINKSDCTDTDTKASRALDMVSRLCRPKRASFGTCLALTVVMALLFVSLSSYIIPEPSQKELYAYKGSDSINNGSKPAADKEILAQDTDEETQDDSSPPPWYLALISEFPGEITWKHDLQSVFSSTNDFVYGIAESQTNPSNPDSDLYTLARMIHAESHWESYIAKLAAGQCAFDRWQNTYLLPGQRYCWNPGGDKTLADIITQPGQFAYASNLYGCGECLQAAKDVMSGTRAFPNHVVTYFRRLDSSNDWVSTPYLGHVDAHAFYGWERPVTDE